MTLDQLAEGVHVREIRTGREGEIVRRTGHTLPSMVAVVFYDNPRQNVTRVAPTELEIVDD